MSRVVVIGAGPGGIVAARRLKDRAGSDVEVVLFEQSSAVEYLPASIPVLLGHGAREKWRTNVSIEGVSVRSGEVEEVSGTGVKVDGEQLPADAVIAAPGLALDHERVPDVSNVHSFWDPAGAEAAADAVRGLRGQTVAVVISGLPYRCPPAPYGLAMGLAARYRDEGRDVRVILTTPEPEPLTNLGGGVPEFLEKSCVEAGVELAAGFEPMLAALEDGTLRSSDGQTLDCDLALVVPPHVRPPLLAGLPGGPTVEVSPHFESAEPGLFVVGDAAMSSLPRAADAAAAGGKTAADAILERLGLSEGQEPHLPEPECYVAHGGGRYSRISLRYPDGLPPEGGAEVSVEGPSKELTSGFEEAFGRWRALRNA